MKHKSTLFSVAFFQILAIMLIPASYLQGQTSHNVSVSNNVYTPAELVINAGDTVIWKNIQGYHNVNGMQSTFSSNPESFGNALGFNWTYSHVFTQPGKYDYQCDPHVSLGMKATITVEAKIESTSLTVNFTGMTPHLGQKLFFVVKSKKGGDEIGRVYRTIETDFSIVVEGILTGESYEVEFFADHNGNGSYDVPPVDHAWSLDLENVSGDEILNFSHNTNFKDIEWEHRAFVNFSGMNPHVGQELHIALFDKETGKEIDRESYIVSEAFTSDLGNIVPGKSYTIDFFSDHNQNSRYDSPPADHAWRIDLDSAEGDEIIAFSHNTNFTDISWKHKLDILFSGMTPHAGQKLTLYLKESSANSYTDTLVVESIPGSEFSISDFRIQTGKSYTIDFYADHNGNGVYDTPPADHAWRLETATISGDTEINFSHNTNFTNIFETTGTESLTRSINGVIYPVPAFSELFVSINGLSTERIEIYDITGKFVKAMRNTTGEETVRMDISELKPGVYVMKAITSTNYFTKKFIKK